MSERQIIPHHIAPSAWTDLARADPVRHDERKVTTILLHAIGITPELRAHLVPKGGILMSIAHGSSRQTGDVDFTAIASPQPYASRLKHILDQALPAAAAEMGFFDLALAVQRFEYRPRQEGFATFNAPALFATIGYARRGSTDETRLKERSSTRVLEMDISFHEQVIHSRHLQLENTEVTIQAYDIEDIIAEKFRALLQQNVRAHAGVRRQDIYDIDWLPARYAPDADMSAAILSTLLIKAESRNLIPSRDSIENPEVVRLAAREWTSMQIEVCKYLPTFEAAFARVAAFYRHLPWSDDRLE